MLLIKEHKEFFKYIFIGTTSAVLEAVLFTALRVVLIIDLWPANILATTIATLYNFLLNKKWAFRSNSGFWRSMIPYLTLFCFNLLFSTKTIQWWSKTGASELYAKFGTMIIIAIWNYILYRTVIFKGRDIKDYKR